MYPMLCVSHSAFLHLMVVATDFLFPKLILALLESAYSFRRVSVHKDQINKEGKIVCLVAPEKILLS